MPPSFCLIENMSRVHPCLSCLLCFFFFSVPAVFKVGLFKKLEMDTEISIYIFPQTVEAVTDFVVGVLKQQVTL